MTEQPLWDEFLESEVEDLSKAVVCFGIIGILCKFEEWLIEHGHIETESIR